MDGQHRRSAVIRSRRTMRVGLALALVAVAGCSSDNEAVNTTPPATTPVATTTADTAPIETTPAVTAPVTASVETSVEFTVDDAALAGLHEVVETLASDDLAGRDNGTPGSVAAQDFLIAQLSEFAQPLVPGATGPDAYRQPFDVGTNVIGVIPGSDLADQYVIVGAHYDHLGSDCTGTSAADSVCNGATDNATGVATAIALGRSIAGGQAPRRSVVIALWDAEEDGLFGSAAYLANPLVPLAQTVAYVNFDMQGTNISPSLRNSTVMVGAETGGSNLVNSARAATKASTLDTVELSLLFGQGRSDHANFANAGIPTVFFTDATPPCYHTVFDDISIVDYPKLQQQVATADALTRDLMNTDTLPTFTPDTPGATYDDAVAIHDLLLQAQPDFPRFSDADRVVSDQFVADLGVIVDAGPDAFDDAAVGRLLSGTIGIVELWATGQCEGFLD
jgi:Peptidase family M28